MMRVLVTGAAGRIGSYLCSRLASKGFDVTALDLRPIVSADFTTLQLDFGDLSATGPLLARHDALIHLAGELDAENWDALEATNVTASRRLLVAAAEAGVAKIVYASSIHAAGYTPLDACFDGTEIAPPDGPYGLSKRYTEELLKLLVRRFSLDAYSLRIGTFRERPLTARERVTWLSPPDAFRLMLACLQIRTPAYRMIWAFSDNRAAKIDREHWSAIGYFPSSCAETFCNDLTSGDDIDGAGTGLIGGRFVQRQVLNLSE